MRVRIRTVILVSCIPLFFAGVFFAGVALSDEGLQVKVTNDGTEDIVVTVYDNSQDGRVVLQNRRISGFTSVPIYVGGDLSGRVTLSWTAESVDRDMPQCGHDESIEVGNSSSLKVHADSSCNV